MTPSEPYHEEEIRGVAFVVEVGGRTAQGYISCEHLMSLGVTAIDGDGWVAGYRRHRALIDGIVARRAPAEGWETVMVRQADLE